MDEISHHYCSTLLSLFSKSKYYTLYKSSLLLKICLDLIACVNQNAKINKPTI